VQRPSSLLISAGIHLAAALALLLITVPAEGPATAAHIRPHVQIVAPRDVIAGRTVPPPKVDMPKPAEPPAAKSARLPRAFQAPALRRSQEAELSRIVEPSLTLVLKEPELARPAQPSLPVMSPPPLKTDNFGQVQLLDPVRDPRAGLRESGFSEQDQPGLRHSARRLSLAGDGFAEAAVGKPDRNPQGANIQAGTFGDVEIGPGARRHRDAAAENAERPLQILSKPRPRYTEEARRLQIEGEVLMEMLFTAAGEARVLRLVRGLGHGLDESAIEAARAIRYTPAERQGLPVDSKAIVHITFQLAY
jgi:TonB family protein